MSNKFLINQEKKRKINLIISTREEKYWTSLHVLWVIILFQSSLLILPSTFIFVIIFTFLSHSYWASNVDDKKSTNDYIYLGCNLVSWKSNLVSSKLLHIFPLRLKMKLLSMPLLSWNGCAFFILT